MNNERLFEKALKVFPGGVNSPVRAFKSVGGTPLFIQRALGPRIWSEEGRSYIDFVGSWGPMILGHAHPAVLSAVSEALAEGLSFGAPSRRETALAEKIMQWLPSIEQLRFVSSGTEATMSAIRLARGYTGRDRIVKFEGCYHGHSDGLLVKAGSGALTLGVPSSPGVPAAIAALTTTLPFNDVPALERYFSAHGGETAAVIVEPVAGNMSCVPPAEGYLESLRNLCTASGAVLIFDEVMTGFRVSLAGAQGRYGVRPDLTTLGKIIGGGMPVGAFGGRSEIMACLAPLGAVYQAGTLSGNPVAMAAGLKTLECLEQPGVFDVVEARTRALVEGLIARAEGHRIPLVANQAGGMFGFFFTDLPKVQRFDEVMTTHVERFNRFFHGMLDQGHYFAPSAFEAGFLSAAHSEADIEETLSAAERVFSSL